MNELVIWYSKNDDDNLLIILSRQRMSSGETLAFSLTATPNTAGARTATTKKITSQQLVDNAHYSYSIDVCPSATEEFYGARITYTYTNAGD